MLRVLLPGLSNQQVKMTMIGGLDMPLAIGTYCRYGLDCGSGYNSDFEKRKNYMTAATTGNVALKKTRLNISPLASSAMAESHNSSRANLYKEVLEVARDQFSREVSLKSGDKDISLAKALLYVAAEDEAFMSLNREIDASSHLNERSDFSPLSDTLGWDSMASMPMNGKNISEWLAELDTIAKEVESEFVSRDIGCYLVEVMEAVNKVLFESRGLKRIPIIIDSKCSYLHSALSSGCASAILLSVIYIEVCRRVNLPIVGSPVGEDFLIWPQMGNPKELFKVTCDHSLFRIVNGECVEDPRSKASEIDSNSLLGLDIATNRDTIGIALANLIRFYWKRASRTNPGLMLTSPLRPVYESEEKFSKDSCLNKPLLRPQELRLAIMASERLLIVEPHNWAYRRDYGMMLYYSKAYEAAIQELSICLAFAPEEETRVLEPFIEKLHLMRLEKIWTTKDRLTVS